MNMGNWKRIPTSKQLADYLREQLALGRWRDTMPGVIRLAGELGVGRDSVEEALHDLEQQGLLRGQGRGRKRLVVADAQGGGQPLCVAIMWYEPSGFHNAYDVELQHRLLVAGYQVVVAPRSLSELQSNIARVAKVVSGIEADAWVVQAGSREVLEWFAAQPTPTLAMFGRHRTVPLAAVGPDHLPALLGATRRLIELGHSRIVQLTRPERRIPKAGGLEQAILDEIASHGITVGSYNLPNWEDSPRGLLRCLDELYRVTPPTALIIDESSLFCAAQLHLARRGILAPEHVSLICSEPEPVFNWTVPTVSHISWNSGPMIHQILRWVAGVANGKNLRRKSLTKAEFVEGGTIGVANEK